MNPMAQIVLDRIYACRTNVRVELEISLAIEIGGQVTDVRQSRIDVDVGHVFASRDVERIAQKESADQNVRRHGRQIATILEEIVGDLRPTGHVRIPLSAATMQQIGEPNQRLAFPGTKIFGTDLKLVDECAPHLFIQPLRESHVAARDPNADLIVF
jgi:hypothetical protein